MGDCCKNLENFDKADKNGIVLLKHEMLKNSRMWAYRSNSISSLLLDLICLEAKIEIVKDSFLEDLHLNFTSYGVESVRVSGDEETVAFCSKSLLVDPKIANKFCISRVNTSADLASEFLIVIRGTKGIKNYLKHQGVKVIDRKTLLGEYVLSAEKKSITLVTKSILKLRVLLFRIKSISSVKSSSNVSPLKIGKHTSEISFPEIRNALHRASAEFCGKISDILITLSYEDKLTLTKLNLDLSMDKNVLTLLNFVYGFLASTSFYSPTLQKTYETQTTRTLFWLNAHIQLYIKGIDRSWATFFLIKILEFLNSLLSLETFQILNSWTSLIEIFSRHLAVLASNRTDSREEARVAYILDQGNSLVRKFGLPAVELIVSNSESKFADEMILTSKNLYVISTKSQQYSTIYKCLDQLSRKIVVIKKLPKDILRKLDSVRNEIENLVGLQSYNVVNYLDSFESCNNLFLVMEYCECGEIVSDGERKTVDEARNIGRQILLGLSYLHANHLVHRDIKPSNILETGFGFVKIADFGESHLVVPEISQGTPTVGRLSGTPLYMAPECLEKGNIGPEADIWSFGCLMARLITGMEPWATCQSKLKVLFMLASSDCLPFDIENLAIDCKSKAFLKLVLSRDRMLRPSASELLRHPYFVNATDGLV